MDRSSPERAAQTLLASLAERCEHDGFGTMSASVYDTAWLSMVRKDNEWLFPECFEFVLEKQLPSGAWESYATSADGILNTAAALLSLKRHLNTWQLLGTPREPDVPNDDRDRKVLDRIEKAEVALKRLLNEWNMDSTDQVGFEILVVSLLNLIEQEGGMAMEFPALDALRAVRNQKLAKLPPSTLYQMSSTLYHSLEAFIGHIDFDRVRRWQEPNGSMMGSPA